MAQLTKLVKEVNSRYRERSARIGIEGADIDPASREYEYEKRKARKLVSRISTVASKAGLLDDPSKFFLTLTQQLAGFIQLP